MSIKTKINQTTLFFFRSEAAIFNEAFPGKPLTWAIARQLYENARAQAIRYYLMRNAV